VGSPTIPGVGKVALVTVRNQQMYIPLRFVDRYVKRPYEPLTTRLFLEALRPGSIVLDVGAHIGFFSLIAATLIRPTGKVFAFEPAPDNFEILRRNVDLNGYGNVVPIQKAVDATSGERMFLLAESSDSHSFFKHPLSATKSSRPVSCVAIDEFLAGYVIDVVKLDVEGGEPAAIQGMKSTLRRNSNLTLLAEINPFCLMRAGYTAREYIDMLTDLGFTLELVDEGAERVMPLTTDTRIPTDDPGWYGTLYCRRGLTPRA
jgi:FkbM family methyltransferase